MPFTKRRTDDEIAVDAMIERVGVDLVRRRVSEHERFDRALMACHDAQREYDADCLRLSGALD